MNKCCVENIVSFNIDHQNFEREKSCTFVFSAVMSGNIQVRVQTLSFQMKSEVILEHTGYIWGFVESIIYSE